MMGIFYIIVAIASGSEFVNTLSGGQNFILFAILQAITFAAGVYVILQGVRLILAEIVPAFRGISERLVPDAKPALDCPVVFPYAPNAVLIGFLASFLGGIVGMLILVGLKTTIILPGVVPHFFCGATAGVFGNATGGGASGSVCPWTVYNILTSTINAILEIRFINAHLSMQTLVVGIILEIAIV